MQQPAEYVPPPPAPSNWSPSKLEATSAEALLDFVGLGHTTDASHSPFDAASSPPVTGEEAASHPPSRPWIPSRQYVADPTAQSIYYLADVLNASFTRLDSSVMLLVRQMTALNERLAFLDVGSNTAAAAAEAVVEGAVSPDEQVGKEEMASVRHPERLRESRPIKDGNGPRPPPAKHASRGLLFAPPAPHKRSKSPERAPLSVTPEGKAAWPDDEAFRRKKLEEDLQRIEAEKKRVAEEKERRSQLEQKTRSFMSSFAPPGKPGLFEDEPPMQCPQSSSQQGLFNPLFD